MTSASSSRWVTCGQFLAHAQDQRLGVVVHAFDAAEESGGLERDDFGQGARVRRDRRGFHLRRELAQAGAIKFLALGERI